MSNEDITYGVIANVSYRPKAVSEFDPALIYGQNDMAIKLVLGSIRRRFAITYVALSELHKLSAHLCLPA